MKLINKFIKVVGHYPVWFIFIFFIIIYFLNYNPHFLILGWDIEPVFLDPTFMFERVHLWSDTIASGGTSTSFNRLSLLPEIVIITALLKFFTASIAQFIYNYILFIAIPLSFYYFSYLYFGRFLYLEYGILLQV